MNKALLLLLFFFKVMEVHAGPSITKEHIHIDQFGYLCTAQKIAVISNPQTGYNSTDNFTPGTASNNYHIKRWSDNVTVFQGTLTAWNGGATHAQSGDRVWWFDFSAVVTPEEYYVYDQSNNVGSFRFKIGDDVYKEVLKHAVRTFYYQRCGVAKTSTHAGAGWADAACHIGPLQDKNCRLFNQTGNASTEKDLSGGWHDAGDYNKYVNFTWEALINLLLAYEGNKTIWSDDYNLPESGNGIPDLLDEVKYELDWLLKMQQSNGSVLSIVGVSHATPPSASAGQSLYGPVNTSATLTCASVFALAAIQFKSLGIPAMTTYANTLEMAATNAWTWADANPTVLFQNNNAAYGSVGLGAGGQETDDYGRLSRKISAAVFLYALNGNATYRTFVESNYAGMHLIQWPFAHLFEATQQDVLLYYTKLTGVNVSIVNTILNTYSDQVRANNGDLLPSFTASTDAYRAYMSNNNYTWGSNSSKAKQGVMFTLMNDYNLNAANATNYRNAASGFLHYLHGVNPNAWVYLSNMNSYGAEKSINEFYHTWFHDGDATWDRVGTSSVGPAPGFVPGGPNPSWSLDGCCPGGCGGSNGLCVTLTPPTSQPTQKSYRDWNTTWPQNSWSITENGIYYQAAYIRLVSKFMGGACGTLPVTMQYFLAKPQDPKTVSLVWRTDNEIDNDKFEIERSHNGYIFEKIGEVSGRGTVNGNSDYQFKDENPLEGMNYYRLKQIDHDGQFTYSEVRIVQVSEVETIHLYPNPANKEFTIKVFGEGPASLQVTNALGQVVLIKNIQLEEVSVVNIETLPEGIYVLKITTGEQRYFSKRFLVE